MGRIQVLPPALCNQIAAGEVLERAASAVKELVENSLDAGATSIEIELDDGGKKRLSVTDNGYGMSEEDARLSILRHATSKIRKSSDLAAIATMGFRGEALASMAAVARMSITTQREEDETGTYLHVEAAELQECREAAAPKGTQIVLEDLFFNTPARLKFLKTTATELRRVYEVIEQFALACPEVRWKLTFDGRVKCDWPAHATLRDRALAVFGRPLYENLFPIEPATIGDISAEGLFCSPEYSQSTAGRLYTYVNHRIVKDRTINSAISQAYKEFLHGKQPCVVLFLTIPLDQVDVNVHPTKHEVRFQNQDVVFRTVYRALRQSLEKTPWIRSTSATASTSMSAQPATAARYFEMDPATALRSDDAAFRSPEERDRRRFDIGTYDGRPQFGHDSTSGHATSAATSEDRRFASNAPSRYFEDLSIFDRTADRNLPLGRATDATDDPFAGEPATEPFAQAAPPVPLPAPEPTQAALPLDGTEPKGYFSSLHYIGQHALTYLICSDGDNLVIIDQHAAHERINFERLKQVADDVLPAASQGLLFPILLALDTRLSDILEEYSEFFEKLGFQIDKIGESTHAIRAVPECLSDYDYQALLRDALTDLGDSGRATQFADVRDDILATMACHSSIRAGHKMTPDEVRELFRLMDATGFRSNCPHGRPVHFILSISELEKRFLRTGYSGLH